MAKVKIFKSTINIDDMIQKAYDKNKFLELCKACSNYDQIHNCPPFDFETRDFLKNYKFFTAFALKLIFSKKEIENNNSWQKSIDFTALTLMPCKKILHEEMLKVEKLYENSLFLTMGSCNECEICEKKNNNPCKHPEKMRYSIEALGFDVTKILKDYFDIEIKWAVEGIPEYYTLLCGLLSEEKIEVENFYIKKIESEINSYLNRL